MSVYEANELIEKFIYSCSHELRGPLLSIQGLVGIAEQSICEEERLACLSKINACSHRMDRVIRSLQEYLINEAHDYKPERIDPHAVMDQIMRLFQDELSEKNVILEKAIVQEAPWVMDHHEIFKILRHLVANAIAFSDPCKDFKTISVHIRVSYEGSCLEVVDNGIGMETGSQTRAFEIFQRAHNISGEGIGLFLVKRLVEKNNGEIELWSEERIGTRVRISFPSL